VLSKQLTVTHIPGMDQWADVLTKPLSTAKFLSLLGPNSMSLLQSPLEFVGVGY
ncbi:hypothetical protein A2U01_0079856, partial [Trifolium medium]|nr:hypothetical protein [Trifolium medium]